MRTYIIGSKDFQTIKNAEELLSLCMAEYKSGNLSLSDTRAREFKLKLEDLSNLIEKLKAGGK